jgi:hypothetical protein
VHVLKKVTKSAGGILILFRKDKKLEMLANGGIVKRKIKQLKIRYSKNVIFIVPDYSVDNGLENFVLIMMRKDHDEIESGLGLEPARIKKLSKIQQGCVESTSGSKFHIISDEWFNYIK